MQLPPVEVFISWPQGNYNHPSEVRGPTILIITLIAIPILLILIALRTYTRLRLTKNFGPDDVAILLALVPTVGCAVLTMLAVTYHGWDRHVWDVRPDQLEIALKYAMVVEILFSMACSLTRLSILLLICRIMSAGSGILRRLAIVVIALIVIEEFVFCVVTINTCNPVSDYWTLSLGPQKCINESVHILVAGIINTIDDFCVVLIPIPVVLKLRLPLRQRIFCAMLFGAGFIVCIAGGFRIAYMYQLNTTYDKTWLAYPTWICGTIELYLGIVATSIPAIKPLVTRYFPSILGNNFSRHGQSGNGHIKSFEPYVERSSMKSPFSDTDIDLVKIPAASIKVSTSITQSTEKETPSRTTSPTLRPVISAFSTYAELEKPILHPVTEWKVSHAPPSPEERDSTESSMSSFDTAWMAEQPATGGLGAPRHIAPRKKESREVLVGNESRQDPGASERKASR